MLLLLMLLLLLLLMQLLVLSLWLLSVLLFVLMLVLLLVLSLWLLSVMLVLLLLVPSISVAVRIVVSAAVSAAVHAAIPCRRVCIGPYFAHVNFLQVVSCFFLYAHSFIFGFDSDTFGFNMLVRCNSIGYLLCLDLALLLL
jgi:hypothetical protein